MCESSNTRLFCCKTELLKNLSPLQNSEFFAYLEMNLIKKRNRLIGAPLLLLYAAVIAYASLHYHAVKIDGQTGFVPVTENTQNSYGAHLPENCHLNHGARNLIGVESGNSTFASPDLPSTSEFSTYLLVHFSNNSLFYKALRAPPLS